MSQSLYPFAQYPGPGALAVKIPWIGQVVGPSNYQQGGYNLNATALGMSVIELATFSYLDQSGNYYARAIYPNTSANNQAQAVPPTYVTVKWFAANNSEVANNTNLSAEITNAEFIGQ